MNDAVKDARTDQAPPHAGVAEGTGGRDGESRRIYLFTGIYSAVLYAVLLVAPVLAVPLGEQFSLDAGQIGLLFSLELGAFSLATVPAYLWLTRVPLRWSVGVCTVLVALGHVASGLVEDYGALLVVRVLTSLAAGSITVVLLSLGPRAQDPGRAFGIFVVAQLAMGAVILFVFPALFQGAPVSAVYWTLAALTILCLPAVPLLRGIHLGSPRTDEVAPARSILVPYIAGLASIALFYVALSGVWTFMAQIAIAAGNDETSTNIVIAIATLAGIASALLATILGDSPRRGLYMTLGYAGLAVSVLLLLGSGALVQFAIAAIVFKFGWTFMLPYLLSSVSALGGGAQTMNTVNLMIGGGFAIGPVLAGQLTDVTGGFTAMLVVSAVLLVAALVLGIVLNRGKLVQPKDAPVPARA